MNYYYKFIADTSYPGTEEVFYQMYAGERPTIDYLDKEAEGFCRTNAEGYEYLICKDIEEDEYEEMIEEYYAECSCYWEGITAREYFEEC